MRRRRWFGATHLSSHRRIHTTPIARAGDPEFGFETLPVQPVASVEGRYKGKTLTEFESNFKGQTLDGPDFEGTTFMNANFAGTTLKNAMFKVRVRER